MISCSTVVTAVPWKSEKVFMAGLTTGGDPRRVRLIDRVTRILRQVQRL